MDIHNGLLILHVSVAIGAAALVAAATAVGTTCAATASSVGARAATGVITLVGRSWYWRRVVVLIAAVTRAIGILVLTILHKVDTVRNQVVGALTVAVNSERRTEGRNDVLHQVALRLLRVSHRLGGDEAKVECTEAKKLDVVTLGKVVHHIVGVAVKHRLHVSRGSRRLGGNLLRHLIGSQRAVTNWADAVNGLTLTSTHGQGTRKHFVILAHNLKRIIMNNVWSVLRLSMSSISESRCKYSANESRVKLAWAMPSAACIRWCKDTTSAQGHPLKCVVPCRRWTRPKDALRYTLKMRFVSSQRSASSVPNDALHESSYKHFLDGVNWFAQILLDKFHLTDGEDLLAVKALAVGGQERIQFHTAFDFAGQTAHGVGRFAVREIHHRQDAASISCF